MFPVCSATNDVFGSSEDESRSPCSPQSPHEPFLISTLSLHQGPIHSLAFSPSGKYLASGSTDGRVLLWDIGHGLMIGELKGHSDTIYALKFSRDGEILASGAFSLIHVCVCVRERVSVTAVRVTERIPEMPFYETLTKR